MPTMMVMIMILSNKPVRKFSENQHSRATLQNNHQNSILKLS